MRSTVGALCPPTVVTVFSTGASSGAGAARVRPGRRLRNWVRRRRRSNVSSEPARMAPAPVRPASAQGAGVAASTTSAGSAAGRGDA
jgi:hypothetical protein